MIAGSDFIWYLLSAGGAIVVFLLLTIGSATRRFSRARRALLPVAVFYVACSVYGCQMLFVRTLGGVPRPFEISHVPGAQRTAIVVLGTGSVDVESWDGGKYSIVDRTAAARVLEASRVFKLVQDATVISSGGLAHPERRATATGETMRDALVALGIPRERIEIETVSKTTRDEAVVVASMLAPLRAEQVILVTSESHMRRALGAFRAVGIHAVPAVAREFPPDIRLTRLILPSEAGLAVAANNAHEILGWIYYWMRGWWSR